MPSIAYHMEEIYSSENISYVFETVYWLHAKAMTRYINQLFAFNVHQTRILYAKTIL